MTKQEWHDYFVTTAAASRRVAADYRKTALEFLNSDLNLATFAMHRAFVNEQYAKEEEARAADYAQ